MMNWYRFLFLLLMTTLVVACQRDESTQTFEQPPQKVVGSEIGVELSSITGVSIRRLPDDTVGHTCLFMPDGSFKANALLFTIIGFVAFDMLHDDKALPIGIYAVTIDPPDQRMSNDELRQHVWQKLVQTYEQSFHLNIRRVKREEDVFVIEVFEGGLREMKEAGVSDGKSWSTGDGGYHAHNRTMSELADFLSDNINSFVLDETRDTNSYNFHITIDIFADDVPENWSDGLKLLGLDFHKAKRDLEFTIIEKKPNDEQPSD